MSTGVVKRGTEVWMQEEKENLLDFGEGHAQMSLTVGDLGCLLSLRQNVPWH